MERAGWLVALMLLPLVPPSAAQQETYGVCVNPNGPTVETGRCGPRLPTVGVTLTLITPFGTDQQRVGCQSDCDYELDVCLGIETGQPALVDWRAPVLEALAEGAGEVARRSDLLRPPAVLDMQANAAPEPGSCLTPGLP